MNEAWKQVQGTVMGSMQCTDIRGSFLKHIGYVCAADESAANAFARLRNEQPELFPVPRQGESFWDAIEEALGL
jgi:hypothetical protein